MTVEASLVRPATGRAASARVAQLSSRSEALAAARALVPAIRARAERADQERVTPAESIAELTEAGLFALATPRRHGGTELGFSTMVEVQVEIAQACGSTGWVYGVLTGHNWMLGLFPQEAQAEVFADPRALTASVFRMGGKAVPEAGGYRLTGAEGKFCSGVDHSDWVVTGVQVQREAGAEMRFLLIPMSEVEIVDDWHTAGMRGTGSRTIKIAEAFVPEHRSTSMAELMSGKTPGALANNSRFFRVPFAVGQPFSLVGAPLGMAQAAVAAHAQALGKKLGAMPAEQAAEHGAALARLAHASAEADAARAMILENCALLDATDEPAALPAERKARIQRDFAFAAQKCRYAVTSLFEASGGSGIYDGSAIQRIWRDANSATAHAAFTWDDASVSFARTLAGLGPSKFSRR